MIFLIGAVKKARWFNSGRIEYLSKFDHVSDHLVKLTTVPKTHLF